MTLEEAIQLAQNGDVDAMISLGNYYSKQNTGEGISESEKWYEMAANKGNLLAMYLLVITKQILAYAGLQVVGADEYGLRTFIPDWIELLEWANKLLVEIDKKSEGYDSVPRHEVVKNIDDASYYLALSYYYLDEYIKSYNLLKSSLQKRAKILRGACALKLANTLDEQRRAVEEIKIIEKNNDYSKSFKCKLEENVYAMSALLLAYYYREGIADRNRDKDLEKAFSVLTFIKSTLQHKGNIELLEEELEHYKKKMFGGFKYIE